MNFLDDAALERLRLAADVPDLAETKYEIVRELARGGMGTVYEAWDSELARAVALKVVTAPEAMPGATARLMREARTLAGLEHPGIVPVHDIGTLPDGRLYYAMKLVRGTRLDEVALTSTRGELMRIFVRVCQAVAFAHMQGIVHRDIKPQNIMIGAFGEVLVLDWGIARTGVKDQEPGATGSEHVRNEDDARPDSSPKARAPASLVPTAEGTVLGTPGYMAPEQERGEIDSIDARTDTFALGRLLQWMIETTGEPVPRALAAVCERATSPVPDDRYQRAGLLAADVDAFVDKRPVSAYRERALERFARVATKYRTPILLVLAYLVMRVVIILVESR